MLTTEKWKALFILTGGIAMVQFPTGAVQKIRPDVIPLLGLFAVSSACILSGLAGVWFEKVLKVQQAFIW